MTTKTFIFKDRYGGNIPVLFTDNGDGTYTLNTSGGGGGGGGGGSGSSNTDTVWVDPNGGSPLYYIRQEIDNGGTITYSWIHIDGTAATPTVANLAPFNLLAQSVSSVDLGVKADTAATTDTGTFSLIALVKRLLAKTTSGITTIPSMGGSAISASNPVPTTLAGTNFTFSTINTSVVQLAANATFNGGIESVLNQPNISIDFTCDQPVVLTVNQYIDAAGLFPLPQIVVPITSGGLNRAWSLNGNYVSVSVQNLGTVATTTFNLNTAYGVIPAVTNLGNEPVAINEVAGVAIPQGGSVPVSLTNTTTDGSGSLLVASKQEYAAQTQDQPLFVAITGDPTGDFAGVNLLEALMDPATGLAASVQVVNQSKVDGVGATVLSDSVPFPLPWLNVGQSVTIDTTGYQSLDLTTATLAGTLTISNDGVTWPSVYGFSPTTLGISSSINGTSNYIIGAQARFIRISATTAGTGTAYLRNSPAPVASNNIAMVGGTAVVNGGVAGTLAVGGNVANAVAPTANPMLVGGVDTTTLTRRLETDTNGALAVTSLLYPGAQYGAFNVQFSKATVALNTLTAAQSTISPVIAGGVDQSNVVRVNTMENTGAQVFSPAQSNPSRQSLDELMLQMVALLRVQAYYTYELLQQSQGSRNNDEPDALVADFMAQGNNFANFAN